MFHVKNMTKEDFAFATRITDTMDWNLAEEDFEFMLKLEPRGCFVLFHNSDRVGIVTTVSFGKMGWFGNLIVAETQRNRGAGSLLAKHAVDYLTGNGVETVGLYSYIERIPFYKKLGFDYDSEFIVLNGKGFSSRTVARLREAKKGDVQKIIDLDKICFGSSRRKILELILLNPRNSCHVCVEDDEMLGYAATKTYEDMAELGPLVCKHGRSDIAIDLLKANLARLEGLDVSLTVPKKESKILRMLMQNGFIENFRVARMFIKPRTVKDCVYAAESLERG